MAYERECDALENLKQALLAARKDLDMIKLAGARKQELSAETKLRDVVQQAHFMAVFHHVQWKLLGIRMVFMPDASPEPLLKGFGGPAGLQDGAEPDDQQAGRHREAQ